MCKSIFILGVLLGSCAARIGAGRPMRDAPMMHSFDGPRVMKSEIYGEAASAYPSGVKQGVELLRFVTAYHKGFEAVIDVAPYSPLLHAISSADGAGLTFYTFIDTWVGNVTDPKKEEFRFNSKTKQCASHIERLNSDGNGFKFSAELVFWKRDPSTVDTRPRETVTLASGFIGSTYQVGRITVHEGTSIRDGSAVLLDQAADLTGASDIQVYKCPGGAAEFKHARKISEWVSKFRGTSDLAQDDDGAEAESSKMGDLKGGGVDPSTVESVAKEAYLSLLAEELEKVTVTKVVQHNRTVTATFDRERMDVKRGMPVFFDGNDVTVDGEKFPLEPVGKVIAVVGDKLTLQMKVACLPRQTPGGSGTSFGAPGLKVPKHAKWESSAQGMSAGLKKFANDWNSTRIRVVGINPFATNSVGLMMEASVKRKGPELPLLTVRDSAIHAMPLVGSIDPNAQDCGSPCVHFSMLQTEQWAEQKHAGNKVCVVQEHSNRRLLDRVFELPTMVGPGEKIVMQLAITGHGWAATKEHCGEFCHAIYSLIVNGKRTHTITEFRDDCVNNPLNHQEGTWQGARNGWCPGSVEPGIFLDVTNAMQDGKNHMAVEMDVWSEELKKYEPFGLDLEGYMHDDIAMMVVGLTLFVYDAGAVKAVQAQPHALTAAEAAIVHGSSAPSSLNQTKPVPSSLLQSSASSAEDSTWNRGTRTPSGIMFSSVGDPPPLSSLMAMLTEMRNGAKRPAPSSSLLSVGTDISDGPPSLRPGHGLVASHRREKVAGYDFEGTAPWYLHHGPLATPPGGMTVPIFDGALIEHYSRTVTAQVKPNQLPKDFEWSQAALYVKLEKPEGADIDHWDRVGSMGMFLHGETKGIELFPAREHRSKTWQLL